MRWTASSQTCPLHPCAQGSPGVGWGSRAGHRLREAEGSSPLHRMPPEQESPQGSGGSTWLLESGGEGWGGFLTVPAEGTVVHHTNGAFLYAM